MYIYDYVCVIVCVSVFLIINQRIAPRCEEGAIQFELLSVGKCIRAPCLVLTAAPGLAEMSPSKHHASKLMAG